MTRFKAYSATQTLFYHLNSLEKRSRLGLDAHLAPYVSFSRQNLFLHSPGFPEMLWRRALMVTFIFGTRGMPLLFLGTGQIPNFRLFSRLLVAAARSVSRPSPFLFLMQFWESPLRPGFLNKWTAGFLTNHDAVFNGIENDAYRWVRDQGYVLKRPWLWMFPQYFPSILLNPGTPNAATATQEALSFSVPISGFIYPYPSTDRVAYPLSGQSTVLSTLLLERLAFQAYFTGVKQFLKRVR